MMGKDRTRKLKQFIKENRPSKLKSYVKKHKVEVDDVILNKGRTLLHYCCKHGEADILRYLLRNTTDVGSVDTAGNTPLHLALMRANKDLNNASQIYTEIILPLIQQESSLLEKANHDGITCRTLLDQLVAQRQSRHQSHWGEDHSFVSEGEEEEESWETKLQAEMQEDDFQSFGKYAHGLDDEQTYTESYEDWTHRIHREYHHKKNSQFPRSHRSHTKVKDNHRSQQHSDKTDPDLEKAREKMRQKYEANQKKARENYNLHKKKIYTEKWTKLSQESSDALSYDVIPWPYKKDVAEMKTVLFCDIDNNSEAGRKYVRELQKQWHPDKFVQKLGHRLLPADRDRILERVKGISQELNKWSESMDR